MFLKRVILAVLLVLPLAAFGQSEATDEVYAAEADTSTLLIVTSPSLDPMVPYEEGYYVDGWRLHKGLNAQFSMNVTAGFGSHAPKGVGFGQSVALAYVYPVNDKLMIAAGITANHMKWGGFNSTQVGLRGLVIYNPNDRINLWAYAEKNFVNKQNGGYIGYPWYYDQPSERFAAGGNFKIGSNTEIGFSVEHTRYDNDRRDFFNPGRSMLQSYRGLDW